MPQSIARLNFTSQAGLYPSPDERAYHEAMTFDAIFKNLGRRLRGERNRLRLTQDRLGEPVNVSKAAVSQWESGATVPETKYIAEICHHFGLSADMILVGERSVRVDPTEMQLLELYRGCETAGKDMLMQNANNLYNMAHPERSAANPFPSAPPIPKPGRSSKTGDPRNEK